MALLSTYLTHFSSTAEPRAWCNVTEQKLSKSNEIKMPWRLQGQGSGEPTKHNYEKWCCSWNSLQNGQHRLTGAFKALQRIQDPDTSLVFTMCQGFVARIAFLLSSVFPFDQSVPFAREQVIVQKDYVMYIYNMYYAHLCPHVPLPQPPHEACHSKNHSQDLVALNSLPICPGHAMLHSKVRKTIISIH